MDFYKYSGSGNDFLMFDGRKKAFELSLSDIAKLCDRRNGAGSDGIIWIGDSVQHDFSMRIFNSDGSEAEMCGNGARCSIHYFHHFLSEGKKKKLEFQTMNGVYSGEIMNDDQVRIKMTELFDLGKYDVDDLISGNALYLNTGVPHTVLQVNQVKDVNIESVGRAIRNDQRFPGGTNVCFFELVDKDKKAIRLRVYERGVEAETLCCGTGVMATAVSCFKFFGWTGEIQIKAEGGDLMAIVDNDLKDLYFQGAVQAIYRGTLLSE